MKKPVVLIHGGEAFDTYEAYLERLQEAEYEPYKEKPQRWKEVFADELGEGFEVFQPIMPSNQNAKYREWAIWFEKVLPYLQSKPVFVGHSLGGVFLAKYISENALSVEVAQLHLVAAPFWDEHTGQEHADFTLGSLEGIEKRVERIMLWHSKDDPVVPFSHLERYQDALPNAEVRVFGDRHHFLGETFPELVAAVQKN